MRAELVQETVLDDGDAVGVVGCVQSMGDRDNGASREHRRERALEVASRTRIEQRGGLVQYEGVRIGEHEPREGKLLGLSRSERRTAGADGRLEPLG